MALAAFQEMGFQETKKSHATLFGPYGPSRPERVKIAKLLLIQAYCLTKLKYMSHSVTIVVVILPLQLIHLEIQNITYVDIKVVYPFSFNTRLHVFFYKSNVY